MSGSMGLQYRLVPIQTSNSRTLIMRTPTKALPILKKSHFEHSKDGGRLPDRHLEKKLLEADHWGLAAQGAGGRAKRGRWGGTRGRASHVST